MSGVVARIERIRSGHSDRALIHAIDAVGCEYKIEVPIDQVRDLPPGLGHLLVISWSIHASPAVQATAAATPQAAPAAASAAPTASAPSSVDAQFMALMSRGSYPEVALAKPSDDKRGSLVEVRADGTKAPGTTPEEQLASMLGMPRDTKPTT